MIYRMVPFLMTLNGPKSLHRWRHGTDEPGFKAQPCVCFEIKISGRHRGFHSVVFKLGSDLDAQY